MRYEFDWSVLWAYREALLRGLAVTISLSLIGLTGAVVVGVLIGTGGGERAP